MTGIDEKSTTTGQPVSNFRDLGGKRTADGATILTGRIFRSSQLVGLAEEAVKVLEGLGIKHVYDFRTAQERDRFPDVVINGAENVWLNVLQDDSNSLAATLHLVFEDPLKANQELTPDKIQDLYQTIYENLVTLPSALTAYRAFFSSLVQNPDSPRLFHCTAGKDRTGWAAALFLSLMGVSREDVLADYLESNDQLIGGYKPMIDTFVKAGGNERIVDNLLLVRREYIEGAFAELNRRYGSVQGYFADALGISEADQAALISAFTVK